MLGLLSESVEASRTALLDIVNFPFFNPPILLRTAERVRMHDRSIDVTKYGNHSCSPPLLPNIDTRGLSARSKHLRARRDAAATLAQHAAVLWSDAAECHRACSGGCGA
jgi:hypothetical protein